MVDTNFNEIFGNHFDEAEKNLQNKNLKIQIIDENTNQQKEYNLYSLFLDYKTTLENLYKISIEKKYITYKNFLYFFDQFLLEFKKHGIDYKFEPKSFNLTCPGEIPNIDNFFYNLNFIISILGQNGSGQNALLNDKISSLFYNINLLQNYINKAADNSLSDDLVILNANDFAKVVFSYSSYQALLDSIEVYIKSISSGKIQEILTAAATMADSSSFFTRVTSPFLSWPTVDYPRSLTSFLRKIPLDYYYGNQSQTITSNLRNSKNTLYSEYLLFNNRDGVIWVSESGTNTVSSIMGNLSEGENQSSFDLVYIKIGNNYVSSINKDGSNLGKILNNLKLSQDNFLSNEFFSNQETAPIAASICKIILDQHNLCHPVVTEICINKVDNIKSRYIKALNLSSQESDIIFENIYEDFLNDSNEYRELSWNYFGKGRESFDVNRTIVRFITQDHTIYLTKKTDSDYLSLFKSCINYNNLLNLIKEKIAESEKEINLLEIFLNYFNSILEIYSEKINYFYKNPTSELYADLDELIIRQKLEQKNINKIKRNIRNIIQPEDQVIVDESSNPIDLKSIYNASLNLNFDSELRVAMFSSRINFLGGKSYKEFLDSERKNMEKIDSETSEYLEMLENPGLAKEVGKSKINDVIASNNLTNLISKLVIDNFKKEGQLLQANTQETIQVKFPEFSEEKKSDIYISRDTSFPKLSILLESLGMDNLNLSISFSEFLNDLRFELKKQKHIKNIDSNNLVTSLALFWIKMLSKPEEISSTDSLAKNLISFFENLPLLVSIVNANETLQKAILSKSKNKLFQIIDSFVKQSKFSKIETFKNLSSLVRFYHNNEKINNLYYLISNSKNLNKLYLNNYQVFLKSFIDFNYLLENTLNNINQYSEDSNPLTVTELKDQIYNLKEELKSDPNFGPEKVENLLPSSKLEEIIFFDLESCDISPESFDEAFDKMQGNFDPKKVSSLNNIISIIKQINDIKKYVVHAKPKIDLVLNNNYMFSGFNDSKFRFRTLGDIDPQHFTIGVDTGCCQIIGGAGEGAAIDSFINPNASVIILEINNDSGWTTISQSYFHVVPKEKYFILDNIEAGKYDNNSLKSIIGLNFFEVYAILAQEILKKGFKKVLCGKGYTKVLNADASKFKTTSISRDPRHFEVEGEDFKEINQDSEKYTDFDAGDCYDLGKPNFKVPEVTGLVFAATNSQKNDMLLKISNSVLRKSIKNTSLIKLSNYLSSINLTNYSSRVLLLEK